MEVRHCPSYKNRLDKSPVNWKVTRRLRAFTKPPPCQVVQDAFAAKVGFAEALDAMAETV